MSKLTLLYVTFLVYHSTTADKEATSSGATCHELKLSMTKSSSSPVLRQVTSPSQHAEGPHWEIRQQVLLYVDISSQEVLRFNPQLGEVTKLKIGTPNSPVSVVTPVKNYPDNYVMSAGRDLLMCHWLGETNVTLSKSDCTLITTVDKNHPDNRFNDGKADRSGNLWIGTMGPEPTVGNVVPDQGSLYRVSKHLVVKNKVHPVSISNGLTWSKNDNIMYYIDTATGKIEKFDFDLKTGKLENRATVFDLNASNIEGSPDGMTIDSNGNLWIAVFNGRKIINVNPYTGALLKCYALPVTRPTSVAFGGANLDVLYFTSSRAGFAESDIEKQPSAGSVFEIKHLGVKGVPMFEFLDENREHIK